MNKVEDEKRHGSSAQRVTCPEGRISQSTKDRDGHAVIDINAYIPYFLSAINNALSRGASQYYLENFGIGIVEWRTVSMLAIEPRIPAARICEVVALDKAATSRALSRLQDLDYVDFEASESDPRRKTWWLNKKGYELHDSILAIALERERQLISAIDPCDLEACLRAMRIMRRNVDAISVLSHNMTLGDGTEE